MPVVLGHFFEVDNLCCAVDSRFHASRLAAVAISHQDVVFATLGQLQLMAKGTIGISLCLDESQSRKVVVVLCPPAGMCHAVVYVLTIHVFGLNDNRTMVWLWLLRLFKSCGRQYVGLFVGGCACTVNAQNGCSHVYDIDGEGLCFCIIRLSRQTGIMSTDVGCRLCQRACRF